MIGHTHICTNTRYLAIWKCVSQNNPYMALGDSNKEREKSVKKHKKKTAHIKEGINGVMISAALSNRVLTLPPCSVTALSIFMSVITILCLCTPANNKSHFKEARKT